MNPQRGREFQVLVPAGLDVATDTLTQILSPSSLLTQVTMSSGQTVTVYDLHVPGLPSALQIQNVGGGYVPKAVRFTEEIVLELESAVDEWLARVARRPLVRPASTLVEVFGVRRASKPRGRL